MEKLKWSQIERQKAIEAYEANPNFCLACGKKIEVLENRPVSQVRKKKVCSHKCAIDLRWKDKENQLTEQNKSFGKYSQRGVEARAKSEKERIEERYKDVHVFCLYCNQEISLEKRYKGMSRAAAVKRKFCSFSCVQKYHWKYNREKRLDSQHITPFEISGITLGQLKATRPTWSEAIRTNARKIYARVSRNTGSCESCGFKEHIDVAHKKALKDFSDSALISEINNPDNLLGLCPNCHWKLDHNML